MYSLLLLGCCALLFALVLTPLTRNLAVRLGLVDKPDSGRKLHPTPIPRVGGIPIAVSYAGAFAVLLLASLQGGRIVAQGLPLAWKLMPAAVLIFAVGLLDDLVALKPWQKLAGQTAAAMLACWGGVRIHGLRGWALADWMTIPLTVVWLIGCSNAFNLIDGMDGLAAGVGLLAAATALIAALLHDNYELALATAPLAGCLLGFLVYNFNPATIFLGDSGSLLIGFLLGCYGVLWSQKSATALGLTAPLIALAIPLLDTALAVARRFLRGQPIFGADRGHIHHRLLARGLTPRRVAFLLYGACGAGAAVSLLASLTAKRYTGLLVVVFCMGVLYGVHRLGYSEFEEVRKLVLGGAFRRTLNAQLALRQFEENISTAATPEECWRAIRDGASGFGFSRVQVCFAGRVYSEDLGNKIERVLLPGLAVKEWTITIPLADSEYIRLTRPVNGGPHPPAIAGFADALQSVLEQKRGALMEVT